MWRFSLNLERSLTSLLLASIPAKITCPDPRDPARLILIWDRGWWTSLSKVIVMQQNIRTDNNKTKTLLKTHTRHLNYGTLVRRVYNNLYLKTYRKGRRDGAVVRALASHQCGPGLIPVWCHARVEFIVGSLFTPRVFLRVLRFSSLLKTQHSEFQFDQDRGLAWKPTAKAAVASSRNIVIYLFLLFLPKIPWGYGFVK